MLVTLGIASAVVLGSAVPATSAPVGNDVQVQAKVRVHKAATWSSYFRTRNACLSRVYQQADVINSWKGYSVYYLNCEKVNKTTWKGYIQYRYW